MQLTTAAEALEVLQSGHRVFLGANCSVPRTLLHAMVERARTLSDIEVIHLLTIDTDEDVAPEMAGHVRVNTLFVADDSRAAVNEGRADFTPAFLSEIPRLIKTVLKPNVALVQVTPPDEHGFCSLGVEVSVSYTAVHAADVVIAEFNPQMPRTLGDSFIHVSQIDYAVEVDYPLPQIRHAAPDPIQQAIGQHIAGLIEDGSTLQTGIGGIPDAVLCFLSGHKDLGVHTELFAEGVIELVERGVITNARKTLHPGKIVAGLVLGTNRLYNFIHDNPMIELHPTEYVNDPFVIAQNHKMVAINSAIEVDLTGQVCADSIGHKIYSGAGGQVDFIRGAARSPGGKPIIALPSTARGDTVSRIAPFLQPGAGVVTSRNDVHYVVTEYGVADLYGKSRRARAQALIAIAHPKFRDELTARAKELHYL